MTKVTYRALTAAPAKGWSPFRPAIELRSIVEAAALPWALPWLMSAPRGDGHPVLVLPGFMGGESVMHLHVRFLQNRGYDVSHWGLGRNTGFHVRHAEAIERKIRYLHYMTGRKVSLVGWSLGGVFSLYAALRAPECVRQVITMGSPFNVFTKGASSVPSFMGGLYRLIAHPKGFMVHFNRPRARMLRQVNALPMPVACLYGLSDGIVPPDEAVIDDGQHRHENIRVPASHLGMTVNPMVLWIVADRLAVPEDNWRPFAPKGVTGLAYRTLTPQCVRI